MEDTAASGAYFFSAAADKIIASPATLTGSIGVIAEIPNLEELLARAGIDIEIYKSGEFKDSTSFSRGRTEEEKEIIQEYVDTAYDLFVQRVTEGREMDEATVRKLAQGQLYSGVKAKELGLIDDLGYVEDAVEEGKKLQNLTEAQIVRYKTESPLDILLGRVSAVINPLNPLLVKLTSPGLQAAYLPSL
jgi:protease-4